MTQAPVITERGIHDGWVGWLVTGHSWRDWNAAVFLGLRTRLVVMVAAKPWVHASVSLAGSWGYRSLALGFGDVIDAVRHGGRERRLGPLVWAAVDRGRA